MKFWAFLFSMGLSVSAISQIIVEVPLRAYFENETIKKNNIQSLTVTAKYFDKATEELDRADEEILAFEFDSNGYITYKLSSAEQGKLPSRTHEAGMYLEFYDFDANGKLNHLYREYRTDVYELTQEHDADGNLLKSLALMNADIVSNWVFRWENGKMIEFIQQNRTRDFNEHELFFDELGRMTEIKSLDFRVEFEHVQRGDTLRQTETTYFSDSLAIIERYISLGSKDERYIYYSSQNEYMETESEMNVVYDFRGNVIKYDLVEHFPVRSYPSDVTHYRIENLYDERDLLVSRNVYSSDKREVNEVLIRTETYVYSLVPLEVKLEKGSINDRSGNLEKD